MFHIDDYRESRCLMNETPQLTRIAGGDCGRNDCATISTTDRGTLAVQGSDLALETPPGESVVEIPLHLLREAIRALGW
jgi:hypothetical protein